MIILTILSVLLTFSCYFTLAGLPAGVLAVIALTRNTADPVGARRLTRIGWIVLAAISGLLVVVYVTLIAVGITHGGSTPANPATPTAPDA